MPEYKVAVATPDALVVAVTELTIEGSGLKLPVPVPPVMRNVTPLLYAGFPEASRSVALTTVWLWMLMLSGFTASDMLTGVGGGGVPIVSEALLFSAPTVAVIVTTALTAFAVKVTDATPEAMVTAVPAEKLPAVTSLTVNVTFAPLIAAPAASLTVADTVVLPDEAMVAAPRATTIDVGTWGGVPIVMGALPLIVVVPTVTLARMVAVVFGVTAVNWLVATPDASVTAEDGVNEPAPALITEKVTLTFCITTELALVTTAVTTDVPPLAIAAAESDN